MFLSQVHILTQLNVDVDDGHSVSRITLKHFHPFIMIGELAGKSTAVGEELTS